MMAERSDIGKRYLQTEKTLVIWPRTRPDGKKQFVVMVFVGRVDEFYPSDFVTYENVSWASMQRLELVMCRYRFEIQDVEIMHDGTFALRVVALEDASGQIGGQHD